MIITTVPHGALLPKKPDRDGVRVPRVGADLGKAYNDVMRCIGDDDWACFLDHDAVFTTRSWFAQICEAAEAHPEAGLFGVVTNRVGNTFQELVGVDRDNHDMRYHRKVGKAVAEGTHAGIARMPEYMKLSQSNWQGWLGGVVLVTSKRAWRQVVRGDKVGFPEGYFLGLDNFYHEAQVRLGNPVFLLTRVYVYHWYRAEGDDDHVQRLAKDYSYKP